MCPSGRIWWKPAPTVVCVVAGTIYDAVWFDLVSGQYVPRFFVQATLVHDSANQQFIYTDPKGYVTKFFDNSAGVPSVKQGQFKSFTDRAGNETAASYDPTTNRIASFVQSSGGASSGFHYSYYADGPNAGQLQYATLQVNGQEVRRASYDYYGNDDKHGNVNDLMRVTIQHKNGSDWENLGVTYYRYYKPGEAGGFAHGLRYAVGPHGYAQMVRAGINPETASNAQVARHADHHFQYHEASQGAVVEKVAGGTRRFRFSRTSSGHPADHNNWAGKAVETLPDGTQNIVYTNFAAQVILSINQSGSSQWFKYNRYDSAGRLILAAQSSAVQGYDESSPGLVTLKPHEGLGESVCLLHQHGPWGRGGGRLSAIRASAARWRGPSDHASAISIHLAHSGGQDDLPDGQGDLLSGRGRSAVAVAMLCVQLHLAERHPAD